MKLFYNRPSPYARKVIVTVREKGLTERLTLCDVDPWSDPPDLLAATPVGKVPALVCDDGRLVTESTAICDLLDTLSDGPELIGAYRSPVMARTALASGLMDAAFTAVIEGRRPADRQWTDWVDRQYRVIDRTLSVVDVPPPGRFDLGDISLACALAYLDFRLARTEWRQRVPALARWLDLVERRPSMKATRP